MYLGIEIGGTKLQLGIGPGDGTLAAFERLQVVPADGGAGIRKQILDAVPGLVARAGLESGQLRGMAYGFGGPVDDTTRRVLKSHQVHGWDDFPLADWSEEHLGVPCVLGNDCDVAGLAEALFGAGRGFSPVFYVTVGSGIGGGLILNGSIYRGAGRGGAEIGHLLMRGQHPAPDGSLAEFGPLEDFASGWGIQRAAQLRLAEDLRRTSLLWQRIGGDAAKVTVQHVGTAAKAGDALAGSVLNEALDYLAWGVCQVIALLAPRRIVIGGGVSLLGEELFFEPLREKVARRAFRPFADQYAIVAAELGEEVVVHGALALARQRLDSSERSANAAG
jgi:glucokinase